MAEPNHGRGFDPRYWSSVCPMQMAPLCYSTQIMKYRWAAGCSDIIPGHRHYRPIVRARCYISIPIVNP